MPQLHNSASFQTSPSRGEGLLNLENILSASTISFSEFTAIENALPSSGYKFSYHLDEIYCFSTQASSTSCQAIGQVHTKRFILPFPKFQNINLPSKIENSALRGLRKRVNRINIGHLLATIWNLWPRCDCSTYFLENLWLHLLAITTPIPTETAQLFSLKETVPGLDKYFISLYSEKFVNGLEVLGFEEVVGSCEYVEWQTSGSPFWLCCRSTCGL